MHRSLLARLVRRSESIPVRSFPGHGSRGRGTPRWKVLLAALLVACFTGMFFSSMILRHNTVHPRSLEAGAIAKSQRNRKIPTAPRVALLFFGLTRSLKFTMPSIESNILMPLNALGVEIDVFLHTYNDSDDSSSEHTRIDEWEMLKPTDHAITSQEVFINSISHIRDACWRLGTGWLKAPKIVQHRNMKNLLCQLNSLQEVGNLWQRYAEAHRLRYRTVLFLRPDVLYIDPLPVDGIANITEGTVSIPDWAHYKGMNDRFAALAPKSAAIWKERLTYTLQHCQEKPLHAEIFAQDFAADNNLEVILLQDFEFFRIRSNGSIPRGDEPLAGLEEARVMITRRREELKLAQELNIAHA